MAYLENILFQKTIPPSEVAAIFIEPVQGEGGYIVPPKEYMERLQKLVRKHKILLVADEIQSGMGRTGKMFAFQHEEGVKPDVLILGKALSGGFYPVSAVISRKDLLEVFKPGDHGSTFGGNPLGCKVALEALNVLVEENLVENNF